MALLIFNFEFDYPAPKPDILVAQISKTSGLPVSIVSADNDELHELSLLVAFDQFPKNTLELYAYRPGAIKKNNDKELKETGFDHNWPIPVEGSDEVEGRQRIYINGYVGQEPTLMLATAIALEDLGGVGSEPVPDDEKSNFPITSRELKRRSRKHQILIILFWLKSIVLLPITIPIGIVRMIIGFVMMPFEIRRAYKAVKKKYPNIEK